MTIPLEPLQIGTFYDEWRPLDTRGECRVILHFVPLGIAKPDSLAHRLPSARLQLERTVYYPGQAVRGCFVLNTQKTRTYHSIRIIIEGFSRTHWRSGTGKKRQDYYGAAMLLNCTAAMAGSPVDKKDNFEMGPSANLYPFEYVLPLMLPPTFNRTFGAFNSCSISYRAIGFADVASNSDKIAIQTFRVLAHPSHVRLDYSLIEMAPVHKTANIQLEIFGANTAWAGEQYQLNVQVENHSDKPIEYLQVRLKAAIWRYAKNRWSRWVRTGGGWVLVEKWNCSNLPGLPIAPGQSWSGIVQVTIPADLTPSLHSTQSPLIQNGYRIGVKLATTGNIFTKAAGSRRFMLVMTDRYRQYEHIVAPVEPEGPLGRLTSAPAPPDFNSKIIPAVCTDTKQVECAGQHLGSISALPGAFYPVQAIVPLIFHCPLPLYRYPTADQWEQGRSPTWHRSHRDGLNPASPETPPSPGPIEHETSSSAPN